MATLLQQARDQGVTVLALSEYGITPANQPVHLNRALRSAGLLSVHTQAGMEYLDPWTSRAFAVADHQAAHIYVREPADVPRVRDLITALPGVDQVIDPASQAKLGIDHPRSGELVVIAAPEAWFTYYYWLDDARAPDFARGVDIHRKPGYDPVELFLDPDDPLVRIRAAAGLIRKRLGLRHAFSLISLDARHVRGSHGRLPVHPDDGPVVLCPGDSQIPPRESYAATEIAALLLRLSNRDRNRR